MTEWFGRPILSVADVEASLRFYTDRLGFTSPWRYDDEHGKAYVAQVERQGCALILAKTWPEKVGTVTNTDRMVQLGRKAIEPPGDAREDFWILNELGRRIGVEHYYCHPREVFNEMRTCMDSIAGITWDRRF